MQLLIGHGQVPTIMPEASKLSIQNSRKEKSYENSHHESNGSMQKLCE